MKTLDEVIKAHEFCVNASITGAACEECLAFAKPDCMIREDALHYLKEYRDLLNRTRTERLIDVLMEIRGEK